jgi:DNA repair protein RadC
LAKNISKLPLNDRPYEKLELLGSSNLTNSELLAIIIKTGTKQMNCLELAQNILNGKNKFDKLSDLDYLTNLSLEELKKYNGIGRVKAIQIKAVIELAKRVSQNYNNRKSKISCPKDVFDLLLPSYIGLKQECLKTIILNKQNCVLSIVTNAIGTIDNINIGIKEILSEPIKQLSNSIILVHNHPGGSMVPSKNDVNFTKKVEEYSKIFNIQLLDHIIITNNNYMSMKEMGKF